MTRGDSIPRYSYTMDFNPLDEQSPLTDFWQMNDGGLDSEDAAVIASLATQALQSKMGYEYDDSMGVNEPAEVANYTESRSSPQSQYSANVQEEPAESFRGLMEDHDRGAQFSGADVTTEYDMEPPTRGRISDTVAGFEEQAFLRDSNLHEPLYSVMNVPEMDDTRGTMTASQVVNEVLRNNELAAQSQMDVNMEALHSQAAQLTPPDSESPSISAEERDHGELEENFLTDVEQHDDCEPEDVVGEEPLMDAEAQQQLMAESDERHMVDEDEMDEMDEDEVDEDESRQPSPSPAPRKAGRTRKSDAAVELPDLVQENFNTAEAARKAGRPRKSDTTIELPDLVPEESNLAEMVLREKIVVEKDAVEEEVVEEAVMEEVVMEEAVADGAEINGVEINNAEETPAARRRGRPRKSEIPELTPASSTKRGPGRPPKLAAPEATSESTPATGKRGRPRKSGVEDQSQVRPEEFDTRVDEAPAATPAASKRGRPRKSEVEDQSQVHPESDKPIDEAPITTPATGKRGRPRKSELENESQVLGEKSDIPLEEATAAAAPSKRGRPRKSDVEYNLQMHTTESDIPQKDARATPAAGRRGRPRKSEAEGKPQAHTEEVSPAEATPAALPAAGKRGRPRKSEAEDQSQVHTKVIDIPAEEAPATRPATGKRGRPRKSEVEDKSQVHDEKTDIPAEETPTATATAGKRGRPRRNTLVDIIQAPTDAPQLPVVETSTPSLSKRGRPRKSEVVDTAPASTDEHTLTATEATNSTPAPGRRGRPRKSEVMSTQNVTDEYALSAAESAVPTPALSKRGRPPKGDAARISTNEAQPSIVETTTVTPATGKRGRPRKSDAVLAIAPETCVVPERQAESAISTTADVVPSTTETMKRNKSFGHDEVLEEQQTPLFTAPAQKRGRGRPPKSGILANTATDPEIAVNIEEAEPQGSNSEHMKDPAEGIAVDESLGTEPVPDIWDIEVTPAKKRGRPKSSAMDKPLPMTFAPVTASAKRRGRPPKAPTTEESAETLEEPTQAEAEETERIAKRRRTDSDVVMEGSIEDLIQDLLEDPVEEAMEEPEPEAEERPASMRKRRVSFAADTKAPKSLIPVKFMRRNSDSTGLKAGFFSNAQRTPRLGGRTDNSKENAGAEVPFKSTATQQTELFLSRLPRPTVESVFDEKNFGKRPKTYGRRLKK